MPAWQGRRRRLASATFTNGNNFNFSDALSRPRTYVAAKGGAQTHAQPPPAPTALRHAHPLLLSPSPAEPKLNTVGCPARSKTLQLKVADLRLGATKNGHKTKKEQQRRRKERWSREKNSAKLLQNSGWAESGPGGAAVGRQGSTVKMRSRLAI